MRETRQDWKRGGGDGSYAYKMEIKGYSYCYILHSAPLMLKGAEWVWKAYFSENDERGREGRYDWRGEGRADVTEKGRGVGRTGEEREGGDGSTVFIYHTCTRLQITAGHRTCVRQKWPKVRQTLILVGQRTGQFGCQNVLDILIRFKWAAYLEIKLKSSFSLPFLIFVQWSQVVFCFCIVLRLVFERFLLGDFM